MKTRLALYSCLLIPPIVLTLKCVWIWVWTACLFFFLSAFNRLWISVCKRLVIDSAVIGQWQEQLWQKWSINAPQTQFAGSMGERERQRESMWRVKGGYRNSNRGVGVGCSISHCSMRIFNHHHHIWLKRGGWETDQRLSKSVYLFVLPPTIVRQWWCGHHCRTMFLSMKWEIIEKCIPMKF